MRKQRSTLPPQPYLAVRRQRQSPRVKLWTVARRLGAFSISQLATQAAMKAPFVERAVNEWLAAGALVRSSEGVRLKRDRVLPPRRVRTLPKLPAPPAATKRVWTVVRQLRRFKLLELAMVARVSAHHCSSLLRDWRCTGIVRIDNDGFRLARDLGPLPPMGTDRSKVIIDRNSGKPLEKLPKDQLGTVKRERRVAAPQSTAGGTHGAAS